MIGGYDFYVNVENFSKDDFIKYALNRWPDGIAVDLGNDEFIIFKDDETVKDTESLGVTDENSKNFIHLFIGVGKVDFVTDGKYSELTNWILKYFKA